MNGKSQRQSQKWVLTRSMCDEIWNNHKYNISFYGYE